MPLFVETRRVVNGDHLRVWVEPAHKEDFPKILAARIRAAYFDRTAAEARLRQAISELKMFNDVAFEPSDEQILDALEEELDGVLPEEWKSVPGKKSRPKQLDVQRSELAEIVAHEILTSIFATIVPASRISNKEIPDQPTRGADIVGIEDVSDDNPRIVLVEVKGSCEAKSPPGVINGMKEKLTELSTERRSLLNELRWMRDHSDDENASLCSQLYAKILMKIAKPRLLLTPVLIRSQSTIRDGDPGDFWAKPDSFKCDIRFVSVTIECGDLFDFAVTTYRHARELKQS